MFAASWQCFYCGNPINSDGRHVEAEIEYGYKGGGSRVSQRRFHLPCFGKFERQGGRPWNPKTRYSILSSELVNT